MISFETEINHCTLIVHCYAFQIIINYASSMYRRRGCDRNMMYGQLQAGGKFPTRKFGTTVRAGRECQLKIFSPLLLNGTKF